MKKLIWWFTKWVCIVLCIGVFVNYFKIYQDGNIFKVNHPVEIGKSSGKTAKKLKDTMIEIKNSPELDSLYTNFKEEFTND